MQHGARRRGAARAGDHGPDPVGVSPSIEELLTGPGFLLLVPAGGPVDELAEVVGDLGRVVPLGPGAGGPSDPEDALARACGWDGDGMALVRPDSYLALVADTADPRTLRRYLVDVLRVTERVRA